MNTHFSFTGGSRGPRRIARCDAVIGPDIDAARRLEMLNVPAPQVADRGVRLLQGFTRNVRYAERHEINQLRAKQQVLNRPKARCTALIPVRKSAAWWALSQDERRAVFETEFHHTEIGLA